MSAESAKVVVDLMLQTETKWFEVLQELCDRREIYTLEYHLYLDQQTALFYHATINITERTKPVEVSHDIVYENFRRLE